MSEQPDKCVVCDDRFCVTWLDQHGVAACVSCGLPYLIYHYENNRRVDKPPTFLVKQEWIPHLRRYWAESHRPIPHGFCFPGVYYVGGPEDAVAFGEWCERNKDTLPQTRDAEPVGEGGGV